MSEKLKRIREIQNSGFEVQHVIHRHGMDATTAHEVEGALIDAYPGITNIQGGHGNADRGASHSKEIIERYLAESAEITHPAVEIIVNRSATETSLYDATRFAWRLSGDRAKKAELVLAVVNGLVVEVFSPMEWLKATPENFPEFNPDETISERFGFVGEVANDDVRKQYIRKKVPARARGAANPIRYHNI